MRSFPLSDRLDAAFSRFRELYGEGEVTVLRAPARINILGEHVDYVSYLPTASLPFGSAEHEMLMLFRAGADGAVRGASMNKAFEPFEFSMGDEAFSGESWETQIFNRPAPAPHWSNYVKGAVFFARWKHGAAMDRGISFLVDSTIPANSGASSSSALVVLAGAAIRLANNIEYRLDELAQESSQAEWYLGTRGGALDHTAICLARRGNVVHVSHADRSVELLPLPIDAHRWITFFSHSAAKGSEVMLEYNERAAVSRLLIPAIIEGWKTNNPRTYSRWIDATCDLRAGSLNALGGIQTLLTELPKVITWEEAATSYPQAYAECLRAFPLLVQKGNSTGLNLRDRALHHIGEVRHVLKASNLLRKAAAGETKKEEVARQLGNRMNASHSSLRELYAVSTPEAERMIEIIRNDPQVYGARLMGGGFGGNVLALTTTENAQALVDRVQREFYVPRGRDARHEGSVMISTPGDGLSVLDL